MSPEKRAIQTQNDYVAHMRDLQDSLRPYADTPEKQAQLVAELERYKQGYLAHVNAYLDAKSRVVSPMITGPANFPTSTNAKRIATEEKRLNEFMDWSAKAQQAIREKLHPAAMRAIAAEHPQALELLQAKIDQAEQVQERMVAGNKIIRQKISDDEKIKQLTALGLTETRGREALKPDYMGRIGFPDYELKNNSANIKRMKERIATISKERATPTNETAFEGGRILDNAEANRIQIFFDEKPESGVREKLKAEGFKWAPSEGAWQRQRTDSARSATERIMGVKLGAQPSPAAVLPEPAPVPIQSLDYDEAVKTAAESAEGMAPAAPLAAAQAPATLTPQELDYYADIEMRRLSGMLSADTAEGVALSKLSKEQRMQVAQRRQELWRGGTQPTAAAQAPEPPHPPLLLPQHGAPKMTFSPG